VILSDFAKYSVKRSVARSLRQLSFLSVRTVTNIPLYISFASQQYWTDFDEICGR